MEGSLKLAFFYTNAVILTNEIFFPSVNALVSLVVPSSIDSVGKTAILSFVFAGCAFSLSNAPANFAFALIGSRCSFKSASVLFDHE